MLIYNQGYKKMRMLKNKLNNTNVKPYGLVNKMSKFFINKRGNLDKKSINFEKLCW